MSEKQASASATDLKAIGELLRKKREERSYTLEHVSEITRITLSCLRNIEEGNLEGLPGLVFVRGFVRNYAKLLGLESDWMIEALNQVYTGKPSSHSQSDEEKSIDEEASEPSQKNRYILPLGVAFLIVLLVGVAVWNYKSKSEYSGINKQVETVQALDQDEVTEAAETKVLEEITEDVMVEEEPEETQVISPLTLTLVALKNEWIHLSVDEEDPRDILLTQGEKYDWPAQEKYSLVMTTGDSASIHLNGEEIIERENFKNQLFKIDLNKFTLLRINNR